MQWHGYFDYGLAMSIDQLHNINYELSVCDLRRTVGSKGIGVGRTIVIQGIVSSSD